MGYDSEQEFYQREIEDDLRSGVQKIRAENPIYTNKTPTAQTKVQYVLGVKGFAKPAVELFFEVLEKIIQNYPDEPLFSDYYAMLKTIRSTLVSDLDKWVKDCNRLQEIFKSADPNDRKQAFAAITNPTTEMSAKAQALYGALQEFKMSAYLKNKKFKIVGDLSLPKDQKHIPGMYSLTRALQYLWSAFMPSFIDWLYNTPTTEGWVTIGYESITRARDTLLGEEKEKVKQNAATFLKDLNEIFERAKLVVEGDNRVESASFHSNASSSSSSQSSSISLPEENPLDNIDGDTNLHTIVRSNSTNKTNEILNELKKTNYEALGRKTPKANERARKELISKKNKNLNTCLHIATYKRELPLLIELLTQSLNLPWDNTIKAVDIPNNQGETCLHIAVSIPNNSAIVCNLLTAKSNVTIADKTGAYPIHRAVELSDVETIKTLCEKNKKQISLYNNQTGKNVLHVISRRKSDKQSTSDIFEFIKKHDDPLIYTCDDYGDLPIHTAVRLGNIDVVNLILATDKTQASALQIEQKQRPLHIAATILDKNTVEDIMESLLKNGADINATAAENRTALDIAHAANNTAAVEFLERKGAAKKENDKANNPPMPGGILEETIGKIDKKISKLNSNSPDDEKIPQYHYLKLHVEHLKKFVVEGSGKYPKDYEKYSRYSSIEIYTDGFIEHLLTDPLPNETQLKDFITKYKGNVEPLIDQLEHQGWKLRMLIGICIGGLIGAAIGLCFGGFGAIPGWAIGAAIGAVVTGGAGAKGWGSFREADPNGNLPNRVGATLHRWTRQYQGRIEDHSDGIADAAKKIINPPQDMFSILSKRG